METLLKYLKQKSTWVGIATLASGFGVMLSPEMKEAFISMGISLAGVASVLIDEDKSE